MNDGNSCAGAATGAPANGYAYHLMKSFRRMIKRFGSARRLRAASLALRRDAFNLVRYGPGAPRFAELIWVDTTEVRSALLAPAGTKAHLASALVVDTANLDEVPLFGSRQFDSCVEHWCMGVPWEDTYDYQAVRRSVLEGRRWSGCENLADVALKYKQLDVLFDLAREEGHLRTRKQLDRHAFREFGGVQVCIGKEGKLHLLQNGGFHRIAVAWLLGLPRIPAQVGLVDPEALQFLDFYRHNRPLPGGVQLPLFDGASYRIGGSEFDSGARQKVD